MNDDGPFRDLAFQVIVDSFGRIVPLLVVAIDRPLDFGNPTIADRRLRAISLFVPEQVVESMLLADQIQKVAIGVGIS